MPSHKTVFTEQMLRKLKLPPKGQQQDYFEKLNRGLTLMLRLSYGGTKAWRVVTYERGKSRVHTLGHFPELSVAKAKKAAFAFDPRALKRRPPPAASRRSPSSGSSVTWTKRACGQRAKLSAS